MIKKEILQENTHLIRDYKMVNSAMLKASAEHFSQNALYLKAVSLKGKTEKSYNQHHRINIKKKVITNTIGLILDLYIKSMQH